MPKKPRQTHYMYYCPRCKRNVHGGSNLKLCNLAIGAGFFSRHCNGRVKRVRTVKGPIPTSLGVVG